MRSFFVNVFSLTIARIEAFLRNRRIRVAGNAPLHLPVELSVNSGLVSFWLMVHFCLLAKEWKHILVCVYFIFVFLLRTVWPYGSSLFQ